MKVKSERVENTYAYTKQGGINKARYENRSKNYEYRFIHYIQILRRTIYLLRH